MIIFLSQKRFCSIEAMFCIPANYSKFNPPLNPPGNPPSEVLSFFFSIFQILFQGANRAGQFWDPEDRRPRLHNRDQRVLHREVAWPEAPSEHEPDKEALQRLGAGNLDGQGVTKKKLLTKFWGRWWETRCFYHFGQSNFLWTVWADWGHFRPL